MTVRIRLAVITGLIASMTFSLFGPVTPAAAFTQQTGRVTKVLDGDTFWINVPNDGEPAYRIRVAGVNAMEHGVDYNYCHGDTAFKLTRGLIEGKRVTIRSYRKGSVGSKGRQLRFVEVPDGRDLGTILLQKGLAWAYPSDIEPRKNADYIRLARAAARQRLQIWDNDDCGSGPQQTALLRMQLRWDAEGNDDDTLNGPLASREFVRIHNDGAQPVYLSRDRWILRESSSFYFKFKDHPGAVVPAGGFITVFGGSGADDKTKGRFFWRTQDNRLSLFGDDGDGAYLIDRHNDIRVYSEYPCLGTCTDSLGSKIELSANWDAEGSSDNDFPNGEWVNIRNTSAADVNLKDYMVDKFPYSYVFLQNTILQPGERLRLYVGKGTDDPGSNKYFWGKSASILIEGQKVFLRTLSSSRPDDPNWPRTAESVPTPCSLSRCKGPADVVLNLNGIGGTREVVIKNNRASSVNLGDWMVQIKSQQFHFNSNLVVPAGGTIKLHQDPGGNTPTEFYWDGFRGEDTPLNDGSGSATLYNRFRFALDCAKWGSGYPCG